MNLEDELTQALIDIYHRAGKEAGYWARRFRQALDRNGGLTTAKRMLKPRNTMQRKGLDALLNAGRPELTAEAVILEDRFRSLFTEAELAEARTRLGKFDKGAQVRQANRERLYPDELEPGVTYAEGAKKQIRVNAYERNREARKVCIKKYGLRCAACDLHFEERYGDLGRDFIHVHHLNPVSLSTETYKIDPVQDLRPVCPNCHAMLHRGKSLLSIEELRRIINENAG